MKIPNILIQFTFIQVYLSGFEYGLYILAFTNLKSFIIKNHLVRV